MRVDDQKCEWVVRRVNDFLKELNVPKCTKLVGYPKNSFDSTQ